MVKFKIPYIDTNVIFHLEVQVDRTHINVGVIDRIEARHLLQELRDAREAILIAMPSLREEE